MAPATALFLLAASLGLIVGVIVSRSERAEHDDGGGAASTSI